MNRAEFESLPGEVQSLAREAIRETLSQDIDLGPTLEYIAEVGASIGITFEADAPQYSVGFVQSDCFMLDRANIEHVPLERRPLGRDALPDKIWELSKQLWELQRRQFYRITARVSALHRTSYINDAYVGNSWADSYTEDVLLDVVRGFERWAYHTLREAVEYESSDENVDHYLFESIEGIELTEDGEFSAIQW